MRQRRTGNPNLTRKPGRRRGPLRDLFSDWSARTLARFSRAMNALGGVGGEETCALALKAATRLNGSVNVEELERQAAFRIGRR